LEDCIAAMDALINRIPDVWAGQAAEVFQEQFSSLKPGLNKSEH